MAVRFVSKHETGGGGGGGFQPNKLASNGTGVIKETVTYVVLGGNLHKTNPACSTLEAYDKKPIFFPVDITEDVVEWVARKIPGSSGPGGMD